MIKRISGLYAIVDNSFSLQYDHATLAAFFLKGGAKILQLRMKGAEEEAVLRAAQSILTLKKSYSFTFILNDAVTLAKELKVDGVHVGENDMPVAKVRELVGQKRLIGYSSHSLEEALIAEKMGADYVALGAIFPTKTKGPGHPVQGLEKLRAVVSLVKIPVVAIGGITRNNIENLLQTGVKSFALITGLTMTRNIEEETSWYVNYYEQRGISTFEVPSTIKS